MYTFPLLNEKTHISLALLLEKKNIMVEAVNADCLILILHPYTPVTQHKEFS